MTTYFQLLEGNVGLEVGECMKRWRKLRHRFVSLGQTLKTSSGDAKGRKVHTIYIFLSWLMPKVSYSAESPTKGDENCIEERDVGGSRSWMTAWDSCTKDWTRMNTTALCVSAEEGAGPFEGGGHAQRYVIYI